MIGSNNLNTHFALKHFYVFAVNVHTTSNDLRLLSIAKSSNLEEYAKSTYSMKPLLIPIAT